MDLTMLEKYWGFIVSGTPTDGVILPNLEGVERSTYQYLVTHNWRLEQERISQEDVRVAIGRMSI
jgi:hypothetical protein